MAACDERFSPLDKGYKTMSRFGPSMCRDAVDAKCRKDEAGIPAGDHNEGPYRNEKANGRRERRTDKRPDDLDAYKLAFAPAKSTLCELSRDEHGPKEARRLSARRELRETPPDYGLRAARQNGRRERGRGQGNAKDDQRPAPSTTRRLATRPTSSRANAAGMRTNRPIGCSRVAASDGTVMAR